MESRSTFRSKAEDICYQKQIRDRYIDEGSPLSEKELNLKNATIRPVSRKLARQIIYKYEWLGTMGINSNSFYGIFFKMLCAGVTCFQVPGCAIPGIIRTLKAPGDDITYLVRGACVHWAPPHTNSKLISYSLKYEKKRGKKVAVAYADTDAGEIGTVYQATNWIYTGRGSKQFEFVSPEGKRYTNSAFTQWCRQRRVKPGRGVKEFLNDGWVKQFANPKHRYLYILDYSDKALVERIEAMREPYPKRNNGGSSDLADTISNPLIKGGSIPTLPLQNTDA